jgi:hypothetical protein
MKYLAIGLAMFVGCAEDGQVEPRMPVGRTTQELEGEMRRAEKGRVAAITMEHKRAEEIQTQQVAAMERQRSDNEQGNIDSCMVSRTERVRTAATEFLDRTKRIDRLKPSRSWIRAGCKILDTTATRVERRQVAPGVVDVRVHQVGDSAELKCGSGRPKDLSDDDIFFALSLDGAPGSGDPDDHDVWVPGQCAELDRKDDLPGQNVAFSNKEGQLKILQWAIKNKVGPKKP